MVHWRKVKDRSDATIMERKERVKWRGIIANRQKHRRKERVKDKERIKKKET